MSKNLKQILWPDNYRFKIIEITIVVQLSIYALRRRVPGIKEKGGVPFSVEVK